MKDSIYTVYRHRKSALRWIDIAIFFSVLSNIVLLTGLVLTMFRGTGILNRTSIIGVLGLILSFVAYTNAEREKRLADAAEEELTRGDSTPMS